MTDTIKMYGVNPDGSTKYLGEAPTPPSMKRRELAVDAFGELSTDEFNYNHADFCLEVLDRYHKWLVSQGWTAPPFEMIQENAT